MMHRGRWKKIIAAVLTVAVCFSVMFTLSPASEVQASLRDELNSGQKKASQMRSRLNSLMADVEKANNQLYTLNNKIASTNSKISKMDAQIEKKKEELEKSEDSMDSRLRAMYKSGSVGFIQILFSSEDAEDLISNAIMLRKIYENDQQIVTDLDRQYSSLKSDQKKLKKLKGDLAREKEQVAAKKKDLDAKTAKLNSAIASVDANNRRLQQEICESEQETNQLAHYGGGSGGTYSGGTFMWPCDSRYVSCEFGKRICPIHGREQHSGMDIAASYGTKIYAAASGTVTLASSGGSFGKHVMISHGSGLVTLYAHCSTLLVHSGQHVKRGQVIARVGSTGDSTGPHLHFTVYKSGTPVNPRNYL